MGFLSSSKLQQGSRRQSINAYNIFVLCLLGTGSITFGYTASIISTTLGQPSFIEYFNLATASNAASLIGATNGLFFAGGVVGPLVLPTIADKYGRRWGIATAAILTLVSAALLAGSTNIGEFIFFRFVAGAGAFMLMAGVPLMMNELVPNSGRGGLVDIHAIFFLSGYAIASWIGFGFSFWTTGGLKAWRPPLAIQGGFSLIALVALYWIPESPRWLVMKGREDEARNILNKLHSDRSDPENEFARAEFYQIQKQLHIDRTLDTSWWHMIKKPSYRKRFLIAVSVTGFIQSSGDLVINNYGPTLYKDLGFGPVKQLLYPCAWLTYTLGISIIAMPFVDRVPRNVMIATGIWGCMCALIVESALVASFVPSDNENALQAAVAMFFIFQIFDTGFANATEWAYLGELFPTHIRAKGMSVAVAVFSLMNIIYTQAAPTGFITIGWKFYLLFIILTFIGGFVALFFFPDTRGLPLEEIAAIFGDTDEVAIYQTEIEIDRTTHTIIDHDKSVDEHGMASAQEKVVKTQNLETNV